jgi:hypothetical protein
MERRTIATIDPAVDENSNAWNHIIDRLDDGNSLPGFELERNEDGTYTLYEVS